MNSSNIDYRLVADVVGDVFLRERVAWGLRALLRTEDEEHRVGNMLSWDFDPFLLSNDERISLVVSTFTYLGFVEKFEIEPRKLCSFVTKCAQVFVLSACM